jgi:hypothetical protein
LKASRIVQNWNQFWYFQLLDLVANFYVYMPTKSHTLIPYHLWDHNIQSWRKSFCLPLQKGDSSLLGSKKTTFLSRFRMCLFRFLFLGELGTCPQNLMPTQGVEPWENHQFPEGGMLKFTYKGCFLTIKIAYETFLDWKSKRWKHALLPPLYIEYFIFEKHWNLDSTLRLKYRNLL